MLLDGPLMLSLRNTYCGHIMITSHAFSAIRVALETAVFGAHRPQGFGEAQYLAYA